jgi:GT2 family glycosyltransferase
MVSALSSHKTPIAVFVYKRPEHARLLLESLERCDRLSECVVTIYCDGPKSADDRLALEATRNVVHDWSARVGAEIIARETNLGLSQSIVSGVSELCDQYGRVIVVEDDFVLNRSFIDYMLQGLDRYADAHNVYQISGYMFPMRHPRKPDAFFLPLTTTWGWATWARAWRVFDWDVTNALERLQDAELRREFDLDGSYPYTAMLEQRLRHENDSWGILFWWAVFNRGGLALHPRESLLTVGGFDGSGTHVGSYLWSRNGRMKLDKWDFRLPEQVVVDAEAFTRIKRFLKSEQYPKSVAARIWRRRQFSHPR